MVRARHRGLETSELGWRRASPRRVFVCVFFGTSVRIRAGIAYVWVAFVRCGGGGGGACGGGGGGGGGVCACA
eukprot:6966864-Pyramimonas_sp.AAC.1